MARPWTLCWGPQSSGGSGPGHRRHCGMLCWVTQRARRCRRQRAPHATVACGRGSANSGAPPLGLAPPSERQAAGARDEARCAVSSADARDRRWAPEGRAAAALGAGARSPHGLATLHGDRCCPGHGPSARLGRRSRRGGRWQTRETAACCAASTTRHAPAQWRTASPSSGSVRCAARWRRKRPARRTSRVGPALAPIRRVPGVATRRRVVSPGRAAALGKLHPPRLAPDRGRREPLPALGGGTS